MISNTSYKLRASKSSRDIHIYTDHQNQENFVNDNADGTITNSDTSRRSLVYSSRDGRYKTTRTRHTEFRHTRVGPPERRGYGRGRGAPLLRRERDLSDCNTHTSARLSRNAEPSSMFYRSKCYEPDKKSEIKFNLPEDTRISKLLRRLSMENDQENSLTISKKLLEVLLIPENANYVRKAFHILGESVLDILHSAPGMAAKKQAARALGRMGYIMGQENDFSRFQDWMFIKISNVKDDIKYLFMKALKETLELEKERCVLQNHAENLMHDLVALIEVLENTILFKATLDVLITVVEIYPEEFYSQFRDTTDILLGWHVDLLQPLTNIEFISMSLQRIKRHFQINLDFSITLVYHFFEDIEAYAKDLEKGKSTLLLTKSENNSLSYLTVSILALNTVLKCLGDLLQPSNNEMVTLKFVTDCMMQIIKTVLLALDYGVPHNLLIATNENISLLLGILGTKSNALHNAIHGLIIVQLSLITKFNDATVVSTLLMVAKVVKELSANLSLELVQNLVGPASQLIRLRDCSSTAVQESIICVYQALLNLKNIPLLQEAYRCVLGDLEIMYKQIVPNTPQLCLNNPFPDSTSYENPESSVLFLLRCLSQLANSTGSIIGLWALKPSILELLAVSLEPYNEELYMRTPALQYSLLYLLFSHCKCYNYFIGSSSLVTNQQDGNMMGLLCLTDAITIGDGSGKSPNSGNFALILEVLYKTLENNTDSETVLLILEWLTDVLVLSETYLVILYSSPEFTKLVQALVKTGHNYDNRIILYVGDNLKILLSKKELSWNNAFLTSVGELCVLHMNSNDKTIRNTYTRLSLNIPWDLAIMQFKKIYAFAHANLKDNQLNAFDNYTVTLAQHLHQSGSVYGEILPFHFTMFMKYLLEGERHCSNWLEDIFMCCWPVDADLQTNTNNLESFRSLALSSRVILNNWITFEAAQLCVNTKLRTPLGKPNETFTSFEVVLKQLAKDVMKTKIEEEDQRRGVQKVDRERIISLLQFMEHLEKAIYNATEGCAMSLPQTSKPVRTFFNTNSSTCKEWLDRIRMVLVYISLHVGQSTITLRHCRALLKNFVATCRTNSVDFERTVMYATLALLNLKESESILGLYTWCKNVTDRKLEWVKFSAEQANNRYEFAAKNYASIITAKSEAEEAFSIDSHVQHFIFHQISNCYKEINNWSAITEWQKQASSCLPQNENGFKYSFTVTSGDCAQVLSDADTVGAFNKLNSWNEDPATWTSSWSVYDILRKTESDLYHVAINIESSENEELLNKVNESLVVIREGLQDNLLIQPSEFVQIFSLMHYIANGLKTALNNSSASNVFLVSENFEDDISKIDSTVLLKILWWSEYFFRSHHNPGFNSFCSSVRLHIIRTARKEKNYNLAHFHINKFLGQEDMFKAEVSVEPLSLENIAMLLIQKSGDFDNCTIDFAKATKEIIKLLYATDENKQLLFNLCASVSTTFSKIAELCSNPDLKQISSKILLKLATWLQGSEQNLFSVMELNSPLVKLLMVLPEIGMMENVYTNSLSTHDMAIGKLLQFSVHQCLGMAKNWYYFGTWCYRWGRKMVDHNLALVHLFTEDEQLAVRNCLPMDANDEDLDQVLSALSRTSQSHEDDIDPNEGDTAETIKDLLKNVPILGGIAEEETEKLVKIWRKSRKRLYAYYELSADAYFKYLLLVTSAESVSNSAEYNTITATLRLLRLIVKHAIVLQTVLDNGLANTPTQPWKIIIPQLFSRLNHPEAYVRQRVSEFLCRVAEDAPHLITFPAVVGAVEGGMKFDFSEISMPKDCFSQGNDNNEEINDINEIEEVYESENEETKNVLQLCFKSMVETLSKQAPEAITQVQLLVKELRRITLLWDELWLGTLMQYHNEITQRQRQLELEIGKVNDNVYLDKEQKSSLITEKYRIIMKPIVFILEQLQSITTNVEPETPHEKQFQERYSETIKETLEKLKLPEHPEKTQESWQPLKALQSKFQQKAHKRTAYTLKMQEISPLLAGMKDTVIAMPGLATSSKVRVTIANVANHVSILPTKTKPKKLVFYGSDGQAYPYLFKGLEDLHLDERIMQFLSIANTMMAQGSNSVSNNLYRARHYSVIPLGPRSGLISWVEGTTPVFALYKRWQQREASKATKTGLGQRSNSNPNVGILRPSDLFYNKLKPLLQEHGVKNQENRKEWPLTVLKQVLTELMSETPNDLLAKEFWCSSINAGEWWQIVRNYSYSVAVMSIIGYIIGLGDRHLDNVLVDLSTGEVVHIDYNVCFEKGKTLRVPEKVPFRLTANIEEALAITGVEGVFRLTCESVLKTMKKGRETILTLLEAFVYDPLVDWTVGGEGLAGTAFRGVAGTSLTKQNRKELEKEVTLSMYNVRCTEMRNHWNNNKKDILEAAPLTIKKLNSWLQQHQAISDTEDCLQDLHQQMALVKEAEANGMNNHSLYSLPSRYERYRQTQDAISNAKNEIDKFVTDLESHIEQYIDAVKILEGRQYAQWIVELNISIDQENCRVFDLVREFLQNAGQANMIIQCEQSEADVDQLKQQQTVITTKCLHFLQEYATVLAQCPSTYREKHRIWCYLNWSKYLLDIDSVSACDAVLEQCYNFIGNTNTTAFPVKSVVEYSYHLNLQCKETTTVVGKLYDDLTNLKEANAPIDKIYSNAKLALSSFLLTEKDGNNALKYIILNELFKQNKDYLNAETTLSRNGNVILKLLSQKGGDWFLDDLMWHSNNAVEFINYLLLQSNFHLEDVLFSQVVNAVRAINNVYSSLQELHYNFHTIILPESMKKVLSEESTVMHMISEITNIILGVRTPLGELVAQLEKQLTCVVMEMDINPSYVYITELVIQLKTKYRKVTHVESDNLSQGKMLLMGFNGLFDKLNVEFEKLIGILNTLEIPSSWKKIDQVKQARSLAPPIFNAQVKTILDDIFFLKRLQAMSDFFSSCIEMCSSFKSPMTVIVLNDEQLDKPVKKYIVDFVTRQFLGISTETIAYTICMLLQNLGLNVTSEIEQKDIGAEHKVSMDELNKKCASVFLKQGMLNQNVLAQASSLYTNLKSSWSVIQDIKQKEQRLALLQSTLIRIQAQLTTHSWLHESTLSQTPMGINAGVVRNKFIRELQTETSALSEVVSKTSEAREQQKVLVTSVTSRLNWAAGVNPDVNQVLAAFEDVVSAREKRLNIEHNIANLVFETCKAVLKHELLRQQTSEAEIFDQRFLKLLDKWHNACQLKTMEQVEVSQTEQNIMVLYVPNMQINPKWIAEISERISKIITATQRQLYEQKQNIFVMNDIIYSTMEDLKLNLNKHNKLMLEVKGLIKTMSKIEECSRNTQKFILSYRKYTENLSPLLHCFKDDISKEELCAVLEKLKYVQEHTESIYEIMMNLIEPYVNDESSAILERSAEVLKVKQEYSGRGQQKNAYAMGVWRRVRLKLEGRDPDPGRKYTNQEQVDFIIREASSLDNLALMYEGWTPWV